MNFDKVLKIAASGLRANRAWMTVVAANLANINTTKTDDGKPYRRRTIIFESTPVEQDFRKIMDKEAQSIQMVKIYDIVPDGRDFKKIYDPSNPDADENGMVLVPNINPIEEMANLIEASRAYEANLTVFETSKQMALKALLLGK